LRIDVPQPSGRRWQPTSHQVIQHHRQGQSPDKEISPSALLFRRRPASADATSRVRDLVEDRRSTMEPDPVSIDRASWPRPAYENQSRLAGQWRMRHRQIGDSLEDVGANTQGWCLGHGQRGNNVLTALDRSASQNLLSRLCGRLLRATTASVE
jgi:hypothetical protein